MKCQKVSWCSVEKKSKEFHGIPSNFMDSLVPKAPQSGEPVTALAKHCKTSSKQLANIDETSIQSRRWNRASINPISSKHKQEERPNIIAGGILERLGRLGGMKPSLEGLRAILESSQECLGSSWRRFGSCWGHLGGRLRAKRAPNGGPRGLETKLQTYFLTDKLNLWKYWNRSFHRIS